MIRPAEASDAVTLALLEGRIFGEHAWSADQVRAELLRAGGVTIVAAAPGPVAYAFGWSLAGEAELLRIGVDPDARRRGLGQLVLSAFHAACDGAETIFLEVRASNASAIGLYRRAGYAQVGTRRAYYADGEDAVLMALRP